MSNVADARRRWFGTFFLFVAIGLLIWGQTVLKPYLGGVLFIVYWLACFIFTALAMFVALLDLRAVRQRAQRAQRDLLDETLTEIKSGPAHSPPWSPAEKQRN